MLAAEAGIDLMIRADIEQLRGKSLRMTQIFIELVEQRCAGFGLELASPRVAAERGSQVSLWHSQGYAIMQALIDRGVIGDYREPGNMRFGFAPVYGRYLEIWDAVEILRDILAAESWRDPQYGQRLEVT
jgi:kynureninase